MRACTNPERLGTRWGRRPKLVFFFECGFFPSVGVVDLRVFEGVTITLGEVLLGSGI